MNRLLLILALYLTPFLTASADENPTTLDDNIEKAPIVRVIVNGTVKQVYEGNVIEIQTNSDVNSRERFRLAGEIQDKFVLQFLLTDRLVSCEILPTLGEEYDSAFCRLEIESDRLVLSSINVFLETFETKKK